MSKQMDELIKEEKNNKVLQSLAVGFGMVSIPNVSEMIISRNSKLIHFVHITALNNLFQFLIVGNLDLILWNVAFITAINCL